jgi:hypothetical protein
VIEEWAPFSREAERGKGKGGGGRGRGEGERRKKRLNLSPLALDQVYPPLHPLIYRRVLLLMGCVSKMRLSELRVNQK